MAKKIIIQFNDQPVTLAEGWGFSISVNGFLLTYNNTMTDNTVLYMPYGYVITDPIELAIGVDLNETINKSLAYLQTYFVNNLITYTRVNDTIECRVEADAVVNISVVNSSLELTTQDIQPDSLNLKYYLIYGDYVLNIYQKNYTGNNFEIYGAITIEKGGVDTILETIRGTGLNLSLEANSALTFDEFLLADEFTYKTELIKNGQTIYNGYIKPDGVQQSFVNDEWLVNIESVDGLGLLKDLSFVQTNGLPFLGRLSMYEVIKGCLDRTRLTMTINTSVDVAYLGYEGTNILKDTYVNSERFVKSNKDDVIQDCNSVLNSVLNLFSAVITQENGQWWIYRPNDLQSNTLTTFINNDDDTIVQRNLSAVLGSQINNFYPHHCGANQQIEVKGAISAYRLNYEYGFLDGFITNYELKHDGFLNYEGWTIIDYPEKIINIPNDTSGLIMESGGFWQTSTALQSDTFFVSQSSLFTFKAKLKTYSYWHIFWFKIETSDGYYLKGLGDFVYEWSTDSNSKFGVFVGEQANPNEFTKDYSFEIPAIINDCFLTVSILFTERVLANEPGLTEVSYIQISDDILKKNGWVGEFHTVTRGNPPSSITKENQKVFNGDSGAIFIGSIYKADNTNVTTLWSRKNKFESKALLQISAEDDLRIQSSPIKLFTGDIYGQIPYLSLVEIDNVFGLFMFINYSYDIQTNIISGKLLQLFNIDLGDIQYLFSYDYGNNTIRPTIKG